MAIKKNWEGFRAWCEVVWDSNHACGVGGMCKLLLESPRHLKNSQPCVEAGRCICDPWAMLAWPSKKIGRGLGLGVRSYGIPITRAVLGACASCFWSPQGISKIPSHV